MQHDHDREGTDDHVFAIVPSEQDGISFHDDWDNIGQRLTESGSITLTGVRVPWDSAASYVDKKFRPLTYSTLNIPAKLWATEALADKAGAAISAVLHAARSRSSSPPPNSG